MGIVDEGSSANCGKSDITGQSQVKTSNALYPTVGPLGGSCPVIESLNVMDYNQLLNVSVGA